MAGEEHDVSDDTYGVTEYDEGCPSPCPLRQHRARDGCDEGGDVGSDREQLLGGCVVTQVGDDGGRKEVTVYAGRTVV